MAVPALWCTAPQCRASGKPKYSTASAGVGTAAPDIDAGEQEQPHHVDEVPVPGREFEAEMLLRREMPKIDADQAHDEECRPDDDVETVESGRHEEGRAIDVAAEVEGRMAVLVSLHTREREP